MALSRKVLIFLFQEDVIAVAEPVVIFRGVIQSGCQWILKSFDNLCFLFVEIPVDLVGFSCSPEAFWKSVIVLKASFNARGLLMESVMSSAYAVSLGGYFVGLGTGEMYLLPWI